MKTIEPLILFANSFATIVAVWDFESYVIPTISVTIYSQNKVTFAGYTRFSFSEFISSGGYSQLLTEHGSDHAWSYLNSTLFDHQEILKFLS